MSFGQAQQKFNITSSRANNYCNTACTRFDVPDLNDNPNAIIFITPVEANGLNLDQHPICAYFISKQWSVVTIDNSTMPPGSQFSVEYYSKPDQNHFVHVVIAYIIVIIIICIFNNTSDFCHSLHPSVLVLHTHSLPLSLRLSPLHSHTHTLTPSPSPTIALSAQCHLRCGKMGSCAFLGK